MTWDASVGVVSTVSDAKGAFRLAGLARGPHTVAASARGAGARVAFGRDALASVVELLLVAGPSIVGRVLLPDGEAGGAGRGARGKGGGRLLPGPHRGRRRRRPLRLVGPARGRVPRDRPPTTMPPSAMVGGIRLERGDVEVDVHLTAAVARDRPPRGRRRTAGPGDRRPERDRRHGVAAHGRRAGPRRRRRRRPVHPSSASPPDPTARAPPPAGLAPRELHADARPARARWRLGDVVMEAGMQIRGRVRDKAGAPIADAVVRAFPERHPMAAGGAGRNDGRRRRVRARRRDGRSLTSSPSTRPAMRASPRGVEVPLGRRWRSCWPRRDRSPAPSWMRPAARWNRSRSPPFPRKACASRRAAARSLTRPAASPSTNCRRRARIRSR